ncbi:MAG TPA: leucyl aminopeptidase [Acidimicrobiales bacterium]|nr:leucyl aminopeptidase [Acidimicrobiales bacterium]
MPLSATLTRDFDEVEAIAIGVFSDRMDDDGTGLDWAFLAATGFGGEVGETAMIPGDEGTLLVVVGLGSADDIGPAEVRRAAGACARAMRRFSKAAVRILDQLEDTDVDPRTAAQALSEGLVLASYSYDALRSRPEPSSLTEVLVDGKGGKRIQAALDRGVIVAGAVALARDLVNEPGGSLTPRAFSERIVEACAGDATTVTVMDSVDIEEAGLGGLMGVNRGSAEPARYVEISYDPVGARARLALVGKGITFDSGGLSLKTAEGMRTMKCDMGGAAAVVGAMSVIERLAPKVAVKAYLPLTDNMPGPDATRVGDVLTIRNGKTVEVLNTDAEGRLVLADALSLATEDEPDAIIDVATLTGACMVALGNDIAGLMGRHQGFLDAVRDAGDRAGEELWPLPLPPKLAKSIESSVADIKNISGDRYAGASVAGVFLSNFVGDDIAWAHIDIAGPAFVDASDSLRSRGGTGFGVATLIEVISTFRKPKKSEA